MHIFVVLSVEYLHKYAYVCVSIFTHVLRYQIAKFFVVLSVLNIEPKVSQFQAGVVSLSHFPTPLFPFFVSSMKLDKVSLNYSC